MTTQIIVVENATDWKLDIPDCTVVDVNDYLRNEDYLNARNLQVINLCRGYRYLSTGYYCSLLAEARRHRVIPSVKTTLDISSKAMYSLDAGNLDELIHKSLKRHRRETVGAEFEMDVFFGHCRYPELEYLARQIFETFPCPLLRVAFEHAERWHVESIRPLTLKKLDAQGLADFAQALERYRRKRWRAPRSRQPLAYDLAILHDPNDPLPPSDKRALDNFVRIGKQLGIDVDLIRKKDYARLAEYDALFIRDTTQIAHYTYRFAKKAENEGMVVIDDPTSILRCTNKVYLAELLRANRVPTPRTAIIRKGDTDKLADGFGLPIVLKVPDGSFSRGVFKADDRDELEHTTRRLFKESELILAQEFMYTEFDWRVGILNRKALFACQYYMSKKHWQIVKHSASGRFVEGAFQTLPVEQAPTEVVKVALAAAELIGDGLYGVDVKQTDKGVFVIEVNDNPNLEAGVEDAVLKDELYRIVLREFITRMERRRAVDSH
ncbi:MAG TPA: RimK family protein [Gammaproteobacteria bacterium]|nr:RimK family protein [Gammaproteobacteria bacterium]